MQSPFFSLTCFKSTKTDSHVICILLLISSMFISWNGVLAQSNSTTSDSLLAVSLSDKAAKMDSLGQADSLSAINEWVNEYFARNYDLENWLNYYNLLGWKIYKVNKHLVKAQEILKTAVDSSWRFPENDSEWKLRAALYWKRGYIYNFSAIQNLLIAKELYEEAWFIHKDVLGGDDPKIAQGLLLDLADICARLRDYDKAFQYQKEAKTICEKKKDWNGAAKCCNSIGVMLLTQYGAAKSSIPWFQIGLDLPDIKRDQQLFLLINLGKAFADISKTEESLRITMEAKELLEMVGDSDSITESHRFEHWGDVYDNLGSIHSNNKEWQQAEQDYKLSIEYYLKKYDGECNRDVAQSYYALSWLYNEWGRPDSALHYAQSALRCLNQDATLDNDYSESLFADLWAEHVFYQIFEEKIKAYNTFSYQFPSDTTYLIRCLHACDLLFYAGELLRQEYIFEPTKLYRQQANRQHFETALSACYRLWNLTKNKHWIERAFQYADLARERVQVEGLQKQQHLALPDLPQHRLDSLRNRLVQLQVYHFEKSGVLSGRQKDSLQSEVFYSTLAYQEVLDAAFAANDPARNPRIPWVDLSAVKNLIQPEQALVEYFLGDSDLYVFLLTSETIQFWRMDKPADLDTTLLDFLHSITDDESRFTGADAGIFGSASSRLFDWLLAKPLQSLGEGVNKLVIVPDGTLCRLPFELLGKAQGTVHFKTFPYLIRRYTVSYAYSSDLLLMQSVRARQAKLHVGLKWFAGFAARYAWEDLQRNDISLARRELAKEAAYVVPGLAEGLKAISDMVGGTLFTGFDASERTFKQQARQYRILHFFLHAYIDEQNPLFSKLLFTLPNSGENSDDGDLNAIELYDMNLPAEMVVLSACKTGAGMLQTGEGVMSLSRAFSMAGVPSAVMSLWLVPSEATAQLMTYFYTFLQMPGTAKDEALRKAKLKYIEQAEKPSQPYYWAGFITAGAMQAVY